MDLEIETLAYGGQGVAHHQGQTWFVRGALPRERVEVSEEQRRRGIVEAQARTVLRSSEWREADPCPKALGECGGCDFAHVAASFREQAYKLSLQGALRGGPECLRMAVADGEFFPSPWHYRLRGRLHWSQERGVVGFFAPRSHRVAQVEGCRVLSREMTSLLPAWAQALKSGNVPSGELEFLEDLAAANRVVLFRGVFAGDLPPLPGAQGFWGIRGQGWGEKALTLALPRPLRVPVGAFVQGNRFLLGKLWDTVATLVREEGFERVVDLYGGVGFFAAAAEAGGARQVTVVEVSRFAAQAARANLPGSQVLGVPAEVAVKTGVASGTDLVIVDPPRGGLSQSVRHALATGSSSAIVYISCDPACLARDARALVDAGWLPRWVKLFDLFAGTHHVELAVLFQRP